MRITLAHGAGGAETEKLVKMLFSGVKLRRFGNGIGLDEMDDGALFNPNGEVVVSSDSYTVYPLFFPGGNIGKLAAVGSINDVAVMGAEPVLALDNIVVEEGFEYDMLRKIVDSMVSVFESEGVALVGGDFKVMPRGKLDGIVISTTVIGLIPEGREPILDSGAKPGDKVIVSGTVGDHGAVITALQMGMEEELGGLESDCAPVTGVMKKALEVGGVHAAKDLTRGGLAMALNEIAEKSGVTIVVEEEKVPIKPQVRAVSEMLGIDPFALASEGKVVLVAEEKLAEEIVEELRAAGFKDAEIIGEVKSGKPGFVVLKSQLGGLRLLDKPTGELTPRIC